MSIFSKRKAPLARQSQRSKISLPSRVITTNDFGFCLPIFAREVIPGDEWKLDISSFLRLSPLSVPTYASIRQTARAFYVRFSSVWLPWNDFYAGRPYVMNGTSYTFDTVPQITNEQIAKWFAVNSEQVTADVTSDFSYLWDLGNGDEEVRYYNFKDNVRRMYTLLLNLGYKINFRCTGTNGMDRPDDTQFSLLPLLCYLRAYYDYYLPSRYTNNSPLRTIFDKVTYEVSDLDKVLNYVRDTLYANFDTDYFSASWLNPDSPISNSEAMQYAFTDPSSDLASAQIAPNSKNSPTLSVGRTQITQDSLNILKSAYDWVIRHGLAGNRYFEQIFAQFGIKLPNILTRRCEFLGSTTSTVMTQDVTSTATTQVNGKVTAVGDYAGKGYASSAGSNIELKAKDDDYGMIIVIHNILPDGGYVQGRNREVMHLQRYDFFQPEFDCVGMQAVRNDELFAMNTGEAPTYRNHQPNGVFGFLPRYSEYRRPYDNLSGDFVINSRNAGMDSYHSFRIFDPSEVEGSFPSNDLIFRQIKPDVDAEKPFSRIFNLTNPSYDHFICVFNIDATVNRYMRTFQDSYLNQIDGQNMVELDPDCQLH